MHPDLDAPNRREARVVFPQPVVPTISIRSVLPGIRAFKPNPVCAEGVEAVLDFCVFCGIDLIQAADHLPGAVKAIPYLLVRQGSQGFEEGGLHHAHLRSVRCRNIAHCRREEGIQEPDKGALQRRKGWRRLRLQP